MALGGAIPVTTSRAGGVARTTACPGRAAPTVRLSAAPRDAAARGLRGESEAGASDLSAGRAGGAAPAAQAGGDAAAADADPAECEPTLEHGLRPRRVERWADVPLPDAGGRSLAGGAGDRSRHLAAGAPGDPRAGAARRAPWAAA